MGYKKPSPKTAAAQATSATVRMYSAIARTATAAADEMLKQAQQTLAAEQNAQLKDQIKNVESAKDALKKAIESFSVAHTMQGQYDYTVKNMPANATRQGRAQYQKGHEEAKNDNKNALQSITTQTTALQEACDQLRKTLGMRSEADILKSPNNQGMDSAKKIMKELQQGNPINAPMKPVSTTSAIALTQIHLEQQEQDVSKKFRS